MWKALITIFTLLAFTACSSMQVIQTTDAAAVRQGVQAGDQVRIQTRAGATYQLTVQRITDTAIEGVGRDGRAHSVVLDSIAKLEKQTAGSGTNVWVVVGIVAAVGLVIALVAGGDGNSGGGSGY
jgi:hypothetical protein